MSESRLWIDYLKPRSTFEVLLFLFLLSAFPLLFFGFSGVSSSFTGGLFWNLGHYFLFAAAAYVTIERLKQKPKYVYYGSLLVLVAISAAAEIVQFFTPRDADFLDLIANIIGVLVVWSWYWKPTWYVWIGRCLFFGIVLIHCLFVLTAACWRFQLNLQQPVVANFERFDEKFRWEGKVKLVDVNASEGKQSLQFTLSTKKYSGIALVIVPENWSNYNEFAFDLYNPSSQTFELEFRAHDKHHRKSRFAYEDRFNAVLQVSPGWNLYKISLERIKNAPKSRKMDMEHMRELTIFSLGLEQPQQLFTDNWRLL